MTTTLKTRPPLPVEMPATSAAPLPDELPPPGIYDAHHQRIVLGKQIGSGGEGGVYDIQGRADLVAKIYHEPPSAEKAEKLIALTQLGAERLSRISAWPVEVLRERPDGKVIGFVMKKIGQAEEVHTLHSPKSRLKKFPDASWAFLVHVAANIARAVAALHEQGLVVGDVNPKNILVTKKATVYLLDTDSFQFAVAGKTYRCEGGFPEYTPPELQGIPFSEVDRQQAHDCFGLAVVIFQLLFLGRHPFSGRFLGAGEMPLEKAIREFRFAYGADAVERQMQPPPGTLSLEAIPPFVAELLRRAFLKMERPNAHEWIEPLTQLASSLRHCVLHSGHAYYDALAECPWCQIETRARMRLFNFNLTEARSQRGTFHLDEIWAQVEKLQVLEIPEPHVTVIPQLSPAVIEYTNEMRVRFWLAIIFAGLGGMFSALVGGFCASFWLLPIVLLTVRWIAGTKKQRDDKSMQTLFTAQFDLPNRPLAKVIAQRRKEAEDYIQATEPRLVSQKEAQLYSAKVQALNAKLWDYEALPEKDHRKFQLEHEITSSTQYLRQLKQQLEAKQEQFLPSLTKAKQAVAEADKNLEVMSRRNSSRPITMILIAAFVLTLLFARDSRFLLGAIMPDFSDFDDSGEYQPPPPPPPLPTGKVESIVPASSDFEEFYKEGKDQLKHGDLKAAKDSFLNASTFTDTGNWKQTYASLYYDLCRLRVRLKEAGPHIQYLEKQLALRDEPHEEYRFSLTLLYVMTGNNKKAAEEYQILSTNAPILADSLLQVMKEHGHPVKKLFSPK